MSGYTQNDFVTAELDSDLLSTPFPVQTNWHVITGAPCSGKTTLIKLIAEKGYKTLPEIARVYVDRERAKGLALDDILGNCTVTQPGITSLQTEFERKLHVNEMVFLDRGSPDCLTYCRAMGMNPNAVLAECLHHRYASVFILDRFPFQEDGVRFEDDAIAGLIDTWLVRDYAALGYSVLRVPVLPIEERFDFVLERLSEQGLI